MTTSVPTVVPLEEMRTRIASALEIALEHGKSSGDWTAFREVLRVTRLVYESEIKPAANLNKFDRKLADKLGERLERLEQQWETR